MRTWLAIIGDWDALRWVLGEQRMAFPPMRERAAERVQPDDRLLIYTTRGCFGNPTRDRGRVIGEARVAGPVQRYDKPLIVAGRPFTSGCKLRVDSLTPVREGVELAGLVSELEVFAGRGSWAIMLRRPLLELPDRDVRRLRRELAAVAAPTDERLGDYLAWQPRRRRAAAVGGHG